MGHTARMLGLAEIWRQHGAEVMFAIPRNQEFLLEGTDYKIVAVPGYNIKYYSKITPLFSLMLQFPKILFTFIREPQWARKVVQEYNIQALISDNRPFFRTSKVCSVYIAHQLSLPISGFCGRCIQSIYNKIINQFDHCLVPDFPNHALSGKLSINKNLKIAVDFCGPLSRFMHSKKNKATTTPYYDMVFIASGPLPFREMTIARVMKLFQMKQGKFAIVGNRQMPTKMVEGNVDVYGQLKSEEFLPVLENTKALFALAGYTTIMDAYVLEKPLFMWPTPKQGEQEYLANHLKGTKGFHVLETPEEALLLTNQSNYSFNEQENDDNYVNTFEVIMNLIRRANRLNETKK